MESDESTTNGLKTVFHKVALPDYNSKFILREVYRRKVFFNYEKRLRLRSLSEKGKWLNTLWNIFGLLAFRL
ncbi:hypothetical protein ES332_A02G163400v1 [Gossypium tomentosum]|uniref:Uncharacterized protein n=1 Tax=Gossypium tomentosum TaxID=34277 RepID=A0A5D2RI16_GOSTO|nr:hypothetical protein ES332_A02G163400v1 [Gossypium tomentosum]